MHLGTVRAEGVPYTRAHTFTSDGQPHVIVVILVSRDPRAFAPTRERVANPKRRSQGRGLRSILPWPAENTLEKQSGASPLSAVLGHGVGGQLHSSALQTHANAKEIECKM